ncbi:MAG: hypothetical protein Hyperionvirus2_199 [Hyperionvirus sp.]|uniref:Uncharacterized protein n=1 Tax=Hyperionvirus sp. TaxID=2487770 RepID=A0A3G5A9G9_9VIRU|nr:MAG: hypothetical protein Hyperionvirus2_199 [Hyperionvirus sp.]
MGPILLLFQKDCLLEELNFAVRAYFHSIWMISLSCIPFICNIQKFHRNQQMKRLPRGIIK